jgi:eukaryotic-like serine/threonine-protein kinase
MNGALERLAAALADRYAIERELGAGGMATVYLAHDVRHDRRVALKVLRPELASILGAERFLSEIKTTANLQHPHILSLFDSGEADGLVFYVMPYVEGESLRDRLTREKQLPVEEAVRIAVEVAGALDYAHRHGVVHRDIKPENILLHEGQALVADFGIALAASRSDGGTRMTETGMSLGTPHYMAPEQAMGEKEITPKADVYALGCVLYEMLTAEPPFTGATAQAIIARVMTEEPRSLTLQRRTIPPHVEAATRKALEKLPADRFATAGQFADALTHPGSLALPPTGAALAAAPVGRRRRLVAAVPWVLFGATAALLAWALLRPVPVRVTRERLDLWKGAAIPGAVAFRLAISPDGNTIVYVDSLGGPLMAKDRDHLDATPLTGTEGAIGPVFSPDGQWIAFDAGGKLKKVPRLGGSPITLADSAATTIPSIAWLKDGTIAYNSSNFDLMVVGQDGGPRRQLTNTDSTQHGVADLTPLPGRRVLAAWCSYSCATLTLVVVDLRTGRRTQVVDDAYKGWYLRDGRLVFVRRDGGVFAAPFDLAKVAFRSPPAPVFDGVRTLLGGADMELGADGTLIYATGAAGAAASPYQVVRVDRRGTATVVDTSWTFQQGTDFGLALSPDGGRLAVGLSDGGASDIYVKQLPAGPLTKITFSGINERPTWTANGKTIMYSYRRDANDTARIRAHRADGVGAETTLVHIKRGVYMVERALDPHQLILRLGVPPSRDIVLYTLGADSAVPLVANDRFQEVAPALSPDGKWLAYASDEAGQYQVFVRPFPDVNAGRWQVSANGGTEPQWSRSGRELFYRDGADGLVDVQILPGPTFMLGRQTHLFSAAGYLGDNTNRLYAVLPGDSAFYFVRAVQAQGAAAASSLVLVENWFQELEHGGTGRQ